MRKHGYGVALYPPPEVGGFTATTDKVILTIDRTNWKWGKSNINIFILAVVHQDITIPLYWTMLDKRGNSNTLERTELTGVSTENGENSTVRNFVEHL